MKILKKMVKILAFLSLIFIVFNIGMYIYAKITPAMEIKSANSFSIYDKNNNLIFQGTGTKEWVTLDNISKYVIDATIISEDKHFYQHIGFDYLRIIKALFVNIKNNDKTEGASTITQQYARNLFMDFSKTWKRKIDEAVLALELEVHYSKDDILEGYLNTINYGGVYGIENASKYYFNKSAKDLDLAEASILVGIPKNPTKYSPLSNENLAKKRQKTILTLLAKNKKISDKDLKKALEEKLVYVGKKDNMDLATLMYYQDAVMKELNQINEVPESYLTTGGLKIYTNFDFSAQKALEESTEKALKNEHELQSAGIVMDPKTGKVLALTGGRNYATSQYNRAITAKRQVGSTMKPILYYAALENGFTASSSFTSEPTTFTVSNNQTYAPINYGEQYPNKPISMAMAIAHSDNIFAVKTHLFLGQNILVDTAHRLGIHSNLLPVPSLPLGTEEISLIDMVSSYAAFASEGYKITPYFINKVENSHGEVLYKKNETKENILNHNITFILNELLTSTYDAAFIDDTYPTCSVIAGRLTKKYAIKTGTTDTDLWAIGYNKDVIVGVWNGYDDNKTVEVKDYQGAKYIWADTIEQYLKDKPSNWYEIPSNVVGVLVNPITGNLATENDKNKKIFYFIKGTEPYSNDENLDKVFNER